MSFLKGQNSHQGTVMKYLALIFVLLISACTSVDSLTKNMFNVPSSSESKFDGTKHIRVSAIVCGEIMFELYQDTKQADKGSVLLSTGPYNDIENIANGESLEIKLDGELLKFESQNKVTDHGDMLLGAGGSVRFSHKTYVAPNMFIAKAAQSQEFYVRLHLLNNSYIEGQCSEYSKTDLINELGGNGSEITQKDIDRVNSQAGIVGFRKFAEMMKGF